jgi:hypothetical protein
VSSYRVTNPRQVCSGKGDGVLKASNNAFLVITTFQSAGLVEGENVPSVNTSVNSSLTTVRTV